MRHRKRGRKLGRNSSHRKALCRNILRELFQHGQIVTTVTKAKEYAPMADKMITIAKRAEEKGKQLEKKLTTSARGEVTEELQTEIKRQAQAIRVASFRRALTKLQDKSVVEKIFYEIAPLYEKRSGGYTSVLRMNKTRIGDNARLAVLKLVVDLPETEKDTKKSDKEKRKKEKGEIKRKQKERKQKEKEKERIKKEKEKAKK